MGIQNSAVQIVGKEVDTHYRVPETTSRYR